MVSPKADSLNIHVPWHELAAVLGLPLNSQALPAETDCPLCQGSRLSIYHCNTRAGDWHYCFDCQHSGDLIELAAAAWGCNLPEAVSRLAYEGINIPVESLTEPEVSRYIELHIGKHHRINQLWEKAQKYLLGGRSPVLRKLRTKLVLTDSLPAERQKIHIPLCLGGVKAPDIRKAAFPGQVKPSDGGERIYTGTGWTDVLMIPFYLTPKQVSGFCCIGREGRREDRFMWFPMATALGVKKREREAGLAGLQWLPENRDNYVIALSDPILMTRIQIKNYHTAMQSLPLVAWYTGEQGHTANWSTLHGKRLIFWATQPSPELLVHCCNTEGELVFLGPSDKKLMSKWLRKNPPRDLVNRLVEKAQPWKEALQSWARKQIAQKVARLLNRLDPKVKNVLSSEFPNDAIFAPGVNLRQVSVPPYTFMEKGEKWYVIQPSTKKKEVPYLNARLKIHKIVLRKNNPEWIGELYPPRRDPIPFRIALNDIQNDNSIGEPASFVGAIRKRAREAGFELKFRAGYTRLESVAVAFDSPEIVEGREAVGWVNDRFQFRHCEIRGGKIFQLDPGILPEDCPGLVSKMPSVKHSELETLDKEKEALEPIWAVLTGFLASVVASPCGSEGSSLLMTSNTTLSPLRAFLGYLGTPERKINLGKYGTDRDLSKDWPHKWPFLLKKHALNRAENVQNYLLGLEPETVCYAGPRLDVLGLIPFGGFHLVDFGSTPFQARVAAKLPVARLVLRYLQDLSARNYQLASSQEGDYLSDVREDFAIWIEGLGICARPIRQSVKWTMDKSSPELPTVLAQELFRNRTLAKEVPPSGRQVIVVQREARGYRVTKDQILQGLRLAECVEPPHQTWPEAVWIRGNFVTEDHPSF